MLSVASWMVITLLLIASLPVWSGRIEVESAPGEGTTFTVVLPVERTA